MRLFNPNDAKKSTSIEVCGDEIYLWESESDHILAAGKNFHGEHGSGNLEEHTEFFRAALPGFLKSLQLKASNTHVAVYGIDKNNKPALATAGLNSGYALGREMQAKIQGNPDTFGPCFEWLSLPENLTQIINVSLGCQISVIHGRNKEEKDILLGAGIRKHGQLGLLKSGAPSDRFELFEIPREFAYITHVAVEGYLTFILGKNWNRKFILTATGEGDYRGSIIEIPHIFLKIRQILSAFHVGILLGEKSDGSPLLAICHPRALEEKFIFIPLPEFTQVDSIALKNGIYLQICGKGKNGELLFGKCREAYLNEIHHQNAANDIFNFVELPRDLKEISQIFSGANFDLLIEKNANSFTLFGQGRSRHGIKFDNPSEFKKLQLPECMNQDIPSKLFNPGMVRNTKE